MDMVDATLQRRRWAKNEKNVLANALLSGDIAENTHPDAVPPSVLRQLPGRSSESVRQYVRKHYSELVSSVLEGVDLFGFDDVPESSTGPIKPAPVKKPRVSPKKPEMRARAETPPPEMVPPLPPRAITNGAKRMRLQAHGFMATYLCELPGSSFDAINKKLKTKHRDARTENWDGLPRFM
jgi:hypothetical protein